jgi:chemotaxis protein histidine kinase CheA
MAPAAQDQELRRVFIGGALERLGEAREALVVLAADSAHTGAMTSLLRALHSLKGMAGLMQCHQIAGLAEDVEQLMIQVRREGLPLSGEQRRLVQAGVGMLRDLVLEQRDPGDRSRPDREALAVLTRRLEDALGPVDPC